MALTAGQLHRDGVLRVLATLYADPVGAQQLLHGLGADLARLPNFGGTQVPLGSWFQACLAIEHGAFAFTLEDLLAAAHRDYPSNAVLSELVGAGGAVRPDGAPPKELTVLCLLAGPRGPSQLQLRREFRTIEEAARRGRRRTLNVRLSAATRRADVVPAISEHKPDILHFAGHGSPNGLLLLEEDDGTVAPVSARALATVLDAVGGVTVAVLNACHLGRYLDVISPYAQEVIGAAEPLADEDALAFCRGYYSALALGEPLDRAFAQARAGLALGPRGVPDLRRMPRPAEGGGA
ncbi:CHAT domain-containing protein [Streptomyces sp. TRM S81-3]|uniref:CHAT domain-containing protein n=1 Tax=Streptomyces griseicoloratus TaxID=2752516 RepID=A0A926QRZ3_9ACTN|nr:effector-associated domain EAD1-containing protein [Streptomyces griseicoloratus]MBD0421481.1 CHAT domain-containing protein [Streptomyces griseicoloratus]